MVKVTIQGYLTFKNLLGIRQFSVPTGTSLRDLFIILFRESSPVIRDQLFVPQGELKPHVAVLLNGRHCRHLVDGLNTALEDGDKVAIFPPIVGG